ncbi:hypothetical protein [Mangrovihabitans endophyticus]|uniref:Uncharacterized protein n=1 Tax=Mangrovihabitans endophyticus TaxID=1751298 RepID=A0A8J3FLW9_9ACTN|nr:hypothetical protein [Mangrovihabitans endophyticus]GGK79925.1 hypothetical protein GCM10012284_12410 [Mangrovihabitans endophyticus]
MSADTDGLSSYVPEAAIRDGLGRAALEQAAEGLVAAALERGGPDNVTVVVADVITTGGYLAD